jgi:hypothetical protein
MRGLPDLLKCYMKRQVFGPRGGAFPYKTLMSTASGRVRAVFYEKCGTKQDNLINRCGIPGQP